MLDNRRFEGDLTNMLTINALKVSDGPVISAAGNAGNIFASRDLGQFWSPVRGLASKTADVLRRVLVEEPR